MALNVTELSAIVFVVGFWAVFGLIAWCIDLRYDLQLATARLETRNSRLEKRGLPDQDHLGLGDSDKLPLERLHASLAECELRLEGLEARLITLDCRLFALETQQATSKTRLQHERCPQG